MTRVIDRARAAMAAFRGPTPIDFAPYHGEPLPPFELAPGHSLDEVRQLASERQWFHSFDFVDPNTGERASIRGVDPTHAKAAVFGLPTDLTGQRVLDVGAYDGWFTAEAHRRGAHAVACDHVMWNWPGCDARRNFESIRSLAALEVGDVDVAVEQLSPDTVGGTYDLVLFYGVLYHAPDPLGYLEHVRSVTSGTALIETAVDLLDVPRAALAYYPHASLNGDESNYFAPNLIALEAMVRDAGFASMEVEWIAADTMARPNPRWLRDPYPPHLRALVRATT